MHYLNTSDLSEQEEKVRLETYKKLSTQCSYFNRAIDILIRLQYEIPTTTYDVNTPEGSYRSQAFYWFYNALFTFRAWFVLFERGYYLESNMISRNLIEVYVKMRYFRKFPEKLATFERKDKRPSIQFKVMFDEVLPGYYDIQYRHILSHMAHGGAGALLFKADIVSAKDVRVDNGVFYNENYGSMVLNNITNFIFGYIRLYKSLYPEVIKRLDPALLVELSEIEKYLQESFEGHIQLKGGENEWHKVSRQIWDFS